MLETSRAATRHIAPANRRGLTAMLAVAWPGLRHNLPSSYTSFVGLEQHLVELRGLLDTTRLLTLSGSAGVGKTRLALELAAAQLSAFPHGVWWVELASLADPSLVPQRVATVLDVRELPGRPLIETVAAALRLNAVLLVLDNCEHLVETCAQLADSLLRRCPTLTILTTSRQPLGLPGETVWRVPSLEVPEATAISDRKQDPLATAAVRLLVERAAAARRGFALNQRNGPAVLEICRRLDGIPLTLELAAARLKTISPEQLAARLGDCLSVLAAGSPAALPRQRTLRATIDWSYELLSPPEQRLFRQLSVFAGGFTLEAAEAVCGEEGPEPTPMLDLLSGLVEKSLLDVEERDGRVRYRLLETLRVYSGEKLREATEETILRYHHCNYYADLAEQMEPELFGPEQLSYLDRLDAEHDNFRAALAWTLAEAIDGRATTESEAGARLAAALGQFWLIRGYLTEGRRWLAAALDLSAVAPVARARALYQAAVLAFMQGDFLAATPLIQQSIVAGRQAGFATGAVRSLHLQAAIEVVQGRPTRGAEMLDSALPEFEAEGVRHTHAMWLYGRAQAARAVGDPESALALGRDGLAIARDIGDPWQIRHWVILLGHLNLATDPEAATTLLREGLRISRQMRDRQGTADGIESLGWASAALEQPERAARLLGAAAAVRDSIGMLLFPIWHGDHARAEATARAALGEVAYAAAFAVGRDLPLDRAISFALSDSPDVADADIPVDPLVAGLTPREREVAGLLARGLTNRQIADALIITEGTAAIHVRNILTKLGFSSRAQITAWAVRRGLDEPLPN